MAKTVMIMRHAKSSWDNAYQSDHERPLNPRGQRDALRMGEWVREQDMVPDLIVSSTAERARETAVRFVIGSEYPHDVQYTRAFYHAEPQVYLQALRELPDDVQRVMVVGHNPGMAELVYRLGGGEQSFTTANIAVFALDVASWQDVDAAAGGTLLHLWRPKAID